MKTKFKKFLGNIPTILLMLCAALAVLVGYKTKDTRLVILGLWLFTIEYVDSQAKLFHAGLHLLVQIKMMEHTVLARKFMEETECPDKNMEEASE